MNYNKSTVVFVDATQWQQTSNLPNYESLGLQKSLPTSGLVDRFVHLWFPPTADEGLVWFDTHFDLRYECECERLFAFLCDSTPDPEKD